MNEFTINNIDATFSIEPIPAMEGQELLYALMPALSSLNIENLENNTGNPNLSDITPLMHKDLQSVLDKFLKYVFVSQNGVKKQINPIIIKELGIKAKHLFEIKINIINLFVDELKND